MNRRTITDEDEKPLRELIGLVDDKGLERVRRRSTTFREDVDASLTGFASSRGDGSSN